MSFTTFKYYFYTKTTVDVNKAYIGIDPGKQGGIVINYDGSVIKAHVMPVIGKEYDLKSLFKILKDTSMFNCYCVLEDVHAIFGSAAGSTFDFGYGLGLIEGILTACEIPYTKVAPKAWQKKMFEGVPLITKPSSTKKTMVTDTKKMATIAAQRMFPTFDLRGTEKCRTPHSGVVDALLMCEYSRRNF